jgi:hypothetical protein
MQAEDCIELLQEFAAESEEFLVRRKWHDGLSHELPAREAVVRCRILDADMNADDFRRIALSLEGAEESSHMGSPDFRVGGRIFATLASQSQGYGNLMLTPEQQAAFVEELPEVFLPIAGGWGRMGMTHIRLAAADEDVLDGALRTAWKLRLEKNARVGQRAPAERTRVTKNSPKKR